MQQFKQYHLSPILPDGIVLVVNVTGNVLTLLQEGKIIEQQTVRDTELYIIAEFLEAYPDYCPYEVLLSVLTNDPVEKCREAVNYALENGSFDALMRPVRQVLTRCRIKLRPFGIEIVSLHETGYLLSPLTRRPRKRATPGRLLSSPE